MRIFGTGRGTIGVVRDESWDTRGDLGRVGGHSGRFGTGLGTLGEVLVGSGEVQDGSGDFR